MKHTFMVVALVGLFVGGVVADDVKTDATPPADSQKTEVVAPQNPGTGNSADTNPSAPSDATSDVNVPKKGMVDSFKDTANGIWEKVTSDSIKKMASDYRWPLGIGAALTGIYITWKTCPWVRRFVLGEDTSHYSKKKYKKHMVY